MLPLYPISIPIVPSMRCAGACGAVGRTNRLTTQADKQRIANLALLCLAYIHSPGVETEHVQADAATNKKRAAKGKRELPDYYICRVRRTRQEGREGGSSGKHVSLMFAVRGHFRRLEDGRTIWVRAHFRGLEHGEDSIKPKTYKVD